MSTLKNFKMMWIIIAICLLSIITASAFTSYHKSSDPFSADTITVVPIDSTQLKIDSLTSSLLNEVMSYIQQYHQNCPTIIPESLVKYGLDYDIDICFMMSQAKIETVFGKAGIGRETSKKSIFGVMSKRYDTYDEAVHHYIKVLNKYYLTNNRTEYDLMKRYTTKGGTRYASNPHYEKELTQTYRLICKNTNIKSLQEQLKDLYKSQQEEQDIELS